MNVKTLKKHIEEMGGAAWFYLSEDNYYKVCVEDGLVCYRGGQETEHIQPYFEHTDAIWQRMRQIAPYKKWEATQSEPHINNILRQQRASLLSEIWNIRHKIKQETDTYQRTKLRQILIKKEFELAELQSRLSKSSGFNNANSKKKR